MVFFPYSTYQCTHHVFGLNQDIGIVLLVIFPVNGQKLFVPEI